MFAIYTPNGRTFTGTLESLRGITKSTLTKNIRGQHVTDDPFSFNNKDYAVAPKDIDAYKKAINQTNDREIIRHAFQIMSSPVHAINSEDRINVAIKTFKQYPFTEFPLIDGKRRLVGSLSRENIYEHIIQHDLLQKGETKIKEVFLNNDSKIYTAEPVTDIRRISALLVEENLHAIPILENNGAIIGIVTRTDIIKAVITEPPLSLWC
ncbi:MAG: CBS domain-containing protein [Thalassotalea sp.]|nr:CBS domain-containing protein [Thalassotalea sp.]